MMKNNDNILELLNNMKKNVLVNQIDKDRMRNDKELKVN